MRATASTSQESPSVSRGRFPSSDGKGPDRKAIMRDWDQRGFSCELWVDPPGQEWNDFAHETAELVTVLEGRLEFRVGGMTLVLEPGDELVIPATAMHSVKNIYPRISRWMFGYGR